MKNIGSPESVTGKDDAEQGRLDLRVHQQEREQTVAARERELRLLGFSDELIENYRRATLVGANIPVKERIASLKQQGFNDPIKLIEQHYPIIGYNPEYIQNKLNDLNGQGFKDPIKLAEKNPSVLGFSLENVQNKISELSSQGFKDPIKAMEKNPRIFNLTSENIQNKLIELHNQGFIDPLVVVEKNPLILNLSPENISDKLNELLNLGFNDPVRLIEKMPAILGYTPEKNQNKLVLLGNLGFNDPIRLIEKMPAILGYSSENIKRRVSLFGKLANLYNPLINPVVLMEQEAAMFGAKTDKLLVLTRIAKNSLNDPSEINVKLIHDMIFTNLEDMMLALSEIGEEQHNTGPRYTSQDLIARAKQIKAQKIPKDEKRAEIEKAEYIDPKVKQRYFKGYPLKKDNL